MKQKLLRGLGAVLAAALVLSAGMLLRQNFQYREAERTYAEAEDLAGLPDLSQIPAVEEKPPLVEKPEQKEEQPAPVDPYARALRNMDFAALREVNSDVVGWIMIPDTRISYPLVQGEDNQYYLNHTWKKWSSVVGAIFLECGNSRDLSNFNTIVYGHRMNDGSMFASLKNYRRQSYWQAHPRVYITDDSGSRTYEIFAAYEAGTEENTYQLQFSDTQARQDFIDDALARSVLHTGVTPRPYDRILTLSTCTGSGHATRWVVQAVLWGEEPVKNETQEEVRTAPEEPETAGSALDTALNRALSGAAAESDAPVS